MTTLNDKERKILFPALAQVRNQKEYEQRIKLYESVYNWTLEPIRPRNKWNDVLIYDYLTETIISIRNNFYKCIKDLKKEWLIYKEKYIKEND